jgi:hypothetical protein
MGDVEIDLRNRGVKRSKTRALCRTKWVSVVREAKVKFKRL